MGTDLSHVAAIAHITETGRMGNLLITTLLILCVCSCKPGGTTDQGLRTSDGAGNIRGLLGFQLGATPGSLDLGGWEHPDYGYEQDRKVLIDGQVRDCRMRLDFPAGTLVRITLWV